MKRLIGWAVVGCALLACGVSQAPIISQPATRIATQVALPRQACLDSLGHHRDDLPDLVAEEMGEHNTQVDAFHEASDRAGLRGAFLSAGRGENPAGDYLWFINWCGGWGQDGHDYYLVDTTDEVWYLGHGEEPSVTDAIWVDTGWVITSTLSGAQADPRVMLVLPEDGEWVIVYDTDNLTGDQQPPAWNPAAESYNFNFPADHTTMEITQFTPGGGRIRQVYAWQGSTYVLVEEETLIPSATP